MKEYIDIKKCSTFEQMLIHIMGNFSHKDLREDFEQYGWLAVGELERYSRFGIEDFNEHCSWYDDFVCVDEDTNKETLELENQYQKVAEEAFKLYKMIEKNETKGTNQ